MPRGKILDEYPPEVRKKIAEMVEANYTGKMIYEWLEKNYYPKWRKEHPDWVVGLRTVQNFLRYVCPEKRLLSSSYIREAVKRMESDIDTLERLERSIQRLENLADSFKDEKELSLKEKAELRRISKELVNAYNIYTNLLMRLGVLEEAPKKIESISLTGKLEELRRKAKERKSKEEELYERVVEA